MNLGYELTLEQTQKLVMTPELIQAIKILQFTAQELEIYVADQLLANPVLELDDRSPSDKEAEQDQPLQANVPEDRRECDVVKDERFDWAEHIREREYDDISYRQFQGDPAAQDYSYEQYVSGDVSLTEYLMTQMQFICLNRAACRVAKLIIEALDENGYLTLSPREIAELSSVDRAAVDEALEAVQGLDPPGVGARDLKECLRLQLSRQGQDDPILLRLVEDHLEDIARNRIAMIAKAIGLSAEEAQRRCDIIRNLEPKPGRQFGSSQAARYISADVTVEKVGEDYLVTMNERTTPRLSISPFYRKVLTEADPDSQITDFLNKRLNAAVWLIKSIEQRKRTIYNVVSAIVRHQRDFLELGVKHLKPMTLAEIADEAGIHESTVSRSVNGKYVQTPRGLFELKYFFTGGVCDSQGTGVASGSLKELLKELVALEDPHAPYSDQALVDRLKAERGIDLSRRTVAKYRDELGIAASSKRKRY